jgi:fructokinase
MIVVVGEALVDLVPSGADQLTVHCGGSPFNTARALARLGQPVSFLGCISEDSLGQRLRGALRADGVVLDGVIATRLPPRWPSPNSARAHRLGTSSIPRERRRPRWKWRRR